MTIQQRILSLAMNYGSGEKKKELDRLKKELAATELCHDKATAAAIGYLLAKHEKDDGEKLEPCIYFEVESVVCDVAKNELDGEEATSLIFGLIYLWLKKQFLEEGYESDDYLLRLLDRLFVAFVKEGTIKKSL